MPDPFWFVGNDLAVDFANTVIGTDFRPEALHDWGDVLNFLVRSRVLSEPEAKRLKRQTSESTPRPTLTPRQSRCATRCGP